MATRSNIGALQQDGTIKVIYCHWDGYPEGVGATLAKYYNTPEKVAQLLELGDISSLANTIEETAETAYEKRGEGGTEARIFTNVEEWKEYAKEQWAEYIYIYKGTLLGRPGFEWSYKETGDYWKTLAKYAEELTNA